MYDFQNRSWGVIIYVLRVLPPDGWFCSIAILRNIKSKKKKKIDGRLWKRKKAFCMHLTGRQKETTKLYRMLLKPSFFFVTKRKPVVDKRKNTLFLPNNFCFAFSLLYLDSDIPVYFNESKSMEHKTGCYCREKRTEFIWPIPISRFLEQRIVTLEVSFFFLLSPYFILSSCPALPFSFPFRLS